jgi:hypothetical protein
MSKRPADDGESSSSGGATSFPSPPPTKYQKIQFQPLNFGPVSTLEEMDNKTLRFQNKKLAQVGANPFSSSLDSFLIEIDPWMMDTKILIFNFWPKDIVRILNSIFSLNCGRLLG